MRQLEDQRYVLACSYDYLAALSSLPIYCEQATIYKCGKSGHDALSPVCLYEDEDALENYYCCEWVRATGSKDSWLAIAGAKGIIRIIELAACTYPVLRSRPSSDAILLIIYLSVYGRTSVTYFSL